MLLTLFASQTRELAVPEDAPLAIETRNAQLQNKVEQQHLKRLVLDYEQREGMEEAQCELIIGSRILYVIFTNRGVLPSQC